MKHRFTHRHNFGGTVDSICHQCFRTIATAEHEADLERVEQDHVCNLKDVRRDAGP